MEFEGYFRTFLTHIEELRVRVLRIAKVFGLLFFITIVFDIRYISVFGITFPFIYPDFYGNIGTQFLFLMESHVLSGTYNLITLNATDGLVADLYCCMFLSFAFTLPLIVDQVGKFLSPGLRRKEVDALRSVVVPGTLLFAAGAIIGIVFFIPELFRIFYSYSVGIGALPDLRITGFIYFVLIYMIVFGVSFEVPVFMVMLTRFGLITADYWADKWRYAVVGSLLFGLIFSPGVIGFTMIVMAIPMIALYFGGIYFARRAERKYVTPKETVAEG